jgi:predicted nucleic acid-binding Zn ribbon protein
MLPSRPRRRSARAGARPSTRPRPTGELLDGTFRWLKLDDRAASFRAMRAFALAAGPRICQHARAERLRGAILYVRCESSAWSQHLHVMKAQILLRLARTPGGAGVAELRFNVGPLSDVVAWETPTAPEQRASERHEPGEDVARALANVDDPELREHLARLYTRLGTRSRGK